MTTYMEQDSPTLDETLAMVEKMQVLLSRAPKASVPRWVIDGIDGVDRVREIIRNGDAGPGLREVGELIRTSDHVGGERKNPAGVLYFSYQLQWAFVFAWLLQLAGIDPVSL